MTIDGREAECTFSAGRKSSGELDNLLFSYLANQLGRSNLRPERTIIIINVLIFISTFFCHQRTSDIHGGFQVGERAFPNLRHRLLRLSLYKTRKSSVVSLFSKALFPIVLLLLLTISHVTCTVFPR